MSRYRYRQHQKALRVEKALEEIKARHEEISRAIREVLANKERYLSDDELYMREIPHCRCEVCIGGFPICYGGDILFSAGTMLECWERCPEFTLPDGFKICKWGGGLSCSTGTGFNPETGEVRDYRHDPSFPNWRTLRDASAPYRKKADILHVEMRLSL